MAFIDDIKPYFQTNDYPNQAQFYEMFDKLRWKDEQISIATVTGLQTILNALATPVEEFTVTGTHTYTIPAGHRLEAVIMISNVDATVRIDTSGTAVPGDIMLEMDIPAGGYDITASKMAYTPTNIIVYGLPSGSKIYFVKRKIF